MTKQAGSHAKHLSDEQMLRYRNRMLDVEERRQAEAHLAGCGGCQRALLERMGTVALPAEAAAMTGRLHLEYEELAALVDGKLAASEREHAEEHLLICSSCTRELDGMEQLEAQLAGVAVAAEPAMPVPKVSLGERIGRFFTAPGRLREFGMAGALAVVGAFLVVTAGSGTNAAAPAVRGAARLMDLSGKAFTGVHIGGYLLIAIGAGLLAYSLLRKR